MDVRWEPELRGLGPAGRGRATRPGGRPRCRRARVEKRRRRHLTRHVLGRAQRRDRSEPDQTPAVRLRPDQLRDLQDRARRCRHRRRGRAALPGSGVTTWVEVAIPTPPGLVVRMAGPDHSPASVSLPIRDGAVLAGALQVGASVVPRRLPAPPVSAEEPQPAAPEPEPEPEEPERPEPQMQVQLERPEPEDRC